jgi:hypothetical protein
VPCGRSSRNSAASPIKAVPGLILAVA